jgi:phage-related protein
MSRLGLQRSGLRTSSPLAPCLTCHPGYANIGMYRRMKSLTWLADSRSNVKSFPAGVKDDRGYALYAAQLGERSVKAKPLHGVGGQVMEIAVYDSSGTHRAV